jgi:hypothetical protein
LIITAQNRRQVMEYERATHIGINQAETAVGEDDLQAASFSEFWRALLVSLVTIILVCADLYLAIVTVVALGTGGLQ